MITKEELILSFEQKIKQFNNFNEVIFFINSLDINDYNKKLLVDDVENYLFFNLSMDLYKSCVLEKIKKNIFEFKKL